MKRKRTTKERITSAIAARIAARIAAVILSIALIGCSSAPQSIPSVSERDPLVVFLVRHGEKIDRSRDARLSAAGRVRAAALARALRSAEIEHVHSSEFIRTRETAAPAAAEHGLEVESYDARDLPILVAKLHTMGGRHLVVGHSDTTPSMVELLGGDPGTAIDEAGEFDRLYIVTSERGGAASSVLMRYGEAYAPEAE